MIMYTHKPPEAGSTPRFTALIAAPHILQAFFTYSLCRFCICMIIVDGSAARRDLRNVFASALSVCLSRVFCRINRIGAAESPRTQDVGPATPVLTRSFGNRHLLARIYNSYWIASITKKISLDNQLNCKKSAHCLKFSKINFTFARHTPYKTH